MSLGIRASISKIIDMIQSVVPKTDVHQNFVCVKNLSGSNFGLEASGLGERYFDFVFTSLPEDDGFSGISLRKRVDLQLRIKYQLTSPVEAAFKELQIAEDASSLVNALLGPDYDSASTGVVSIVVGQPFVDTPVQEQTLYTLLILPFTLHFYEEM